MKNEKSFLDIRIAHNYFHFPAYIGFVLVMVIVIALPTIIFGRWDFIYEIPAKYIGGYFLYCFVLALIFSVALGAEKYLRFDQRIMKLCDAAKKVSEGDFSVHFPTQHTEKNRDYIDDLFDNFNMMVEELDSIETLKNDFVANVSHELKTPLASIQNYAQLLQTTELDETQREYVKTIIDSTHRFNTLVFNILRMNKLDNQKIVAKPQSYDLCRQLENCVIGFEPMWEEKEIDLEVDIENCSIIEADEELMELVWNNLLSNAFKFTNVGGSVLLKQYTEGDSIVVEVSDTGCGMSEEVMKHIFDKFYQGDSSHSTEGNGLGLALVSRVLQMTGGTITVDSTEGQGTTFKVKFNNSET